MKSKEMLMQVIIMHKVINQSINQSINRDIKDFGSCQITNILQRRNALASRGIDSEAYRATLSASAKCFWSDQTALHRANGLWPKACCKTKERIFQGKKMWYFSTAKSVIWFQPYRACSLVIKYKFEETDKQAASKGDCRTSQGSKQRMWWCPRIGDFRQFHPSIKNNPHV